jgi:NAD(P)-dependent dehydrogenase (short-subunit alcohol dehydrogenase family)
MRILVIGAAGTVGRAAVGEICKRHEIVSAGRKSGTLRVDISDEASIHAMYAKAGKLDAVVCCAGHTHFGPLKDMTAEQFLGGLKDKLMGQVNLVLAGQHLIADGGSFTLTGGILDRDPIRAGVNGSCVDGAVNSFVMAAAVELPRGLRINAICPGLLQDSAAKYDGYFPGHEPVPSARVGLAYAKSVEGAITGRVILVA